MTELYVFPPSPRAFKVMAIANYLGIEPTLHMLDIVKGEQRSPHYVALNPNKHCFMESNPLDASSGNKVDCADPHTVDPKFAAVPPATTYPSGMYANLQWLKNTILPLGDQP